MGTKSMQREKFSVARFVTVVCTSLLVLSGCMDAQQGSSLLAGIDGDDTVEITLSGSVGDGPVVGGNVVIRGVSGTIFASQVSDQFARYQMTFGVPSAEFPLTAAVEDGLDLVTGMVPDFPLMAGIAIHTDAQVANLNPMGTLAVKIAQRMDGGLSTGNLAIAHQTVRTVLNFGLDTAQFPDPIASAVNDGNIANITRASEAFGEAIRRTRDALIAIGHVADAEQVMDALSADLIDQSLDGRGATGVDPRITVVANVASAQVALETMANQLKVGGVTATNVIDLAIQQVTNGNPDVALTGTIGVSEELLTQARVLIDAVMLIDSNPAVTALRQAIDLVEPGQSVEDLPLALQNSSSDVFEATIQQVSVASAQDIAVVNDAVREGFGAGGNDANDAPTISGIPAADVVIGASYDFTPTAGDVDGDSLSFVIVGKPSWASFDSVTGRLSGTPVSGDQGSYVGIRISVSDGSQSTSLTAFDIAVRGPSNGAPAISGVPASAAAVGSGYDFTPTADDPDNDLLSFSVVNQPAWANFNQLTGRLWGTPDAGESGTYADIRISVSDGSASATLPAFTITVSGLPNRAPSISGSAPTQVNAGSSYSFTPTASDPDGDALTFLVFGQPSWLSLSAATGRLFGSPGPGDVGNYEGIWIVVSDGQLTAILPSITITVTEPPNGAPSISGSAATQATVGSAYSFTPTASDPNGDVLTFSISGRPSWLSFNASSGRLSGTAGAGDVGSYPGIGITVSDGGTSAMLPAFTITVNGLSNGAPSISGLPASAVIVNSSYNFTPTASDPDGDALTFSISGRPSWASFNTGTGRLSGTPGAGAVGTYSGIQISVSDGTDSVSLGAFSIEVIAQALGSATLLWDVPTLNEDGSTLTDLAGFRIYYGTAADDLTMVETINNPTVNIFLVENLHAGLWYFKAIAFDTTGNESVDSDIVSMNVQP